MSLLKPVAALGRLVLGGLALNLLWPRLVVLLSAGPKLNAPPTEGS